MRGGGVEVAARGVLDAGVVGEGGGLAAAGDFDALGRWEVVDVVEVEGLRLGAAGDLAEVGLAGQAGERVFTGDAGEVDGARDEAVSSAV